MGVEHLAQSDIGKEFKRLGYIVTDKRMLSLKEIDNILCQYYPEVRSKYNKIEYSNLLEIMDHLNLPQRTAKKKIEPYIKQKGIKALRKWLFVNGLLPTNTTPLTGTSLLNIITFAFPDLIKDGYHLDINNIKQVLEDLKNYSGTIIKPKKIVKPKIVVPAGVDVTSKEFLATWEWKTLRYEVLVEQGARCKCCGATAADGIVINVDHIKPRRTHPELALVKSNLQVLCNDCNMGKGNWDSTNWNN